MPFIFTNIQCQGTSSQIPLLYRVKSPSCSFIHSFIHIERRHMNSGKVSTLRQPCGASKEKRSRTCELPPRLTEAGPGTLDCQVHNTRCWKDTTGSTLLLVIYTHSPGAKYTTGPARPHGHCPPELSEKPGAVGGRPCSTWRAGCPLVPRRGCDWLI